MRLVKCFFSDLQLRMELIIGVAALLEFIALVSLFQRREAVDGTAMAIAFTVLVPLAILGLGILITRYGLNIAKWTLAALVLISLITAVKVGFGTWIDDPILFVGGGALVLECLFLALVFTNRRRVLGD